MSTIPLSFTINYMIDKIRKSHGLTKKQARDVLLESLIRNRVVDEILLMADFIVEIENSQDEEKAA
ncbi:MAG: hypothetical protein LBJ14_10380 [Desulfarculales bacterium]|nr:hypothetical protein [Desulfarculales bacterium]